MSKWSRLQINQRSNNNALKKKFRIYFSFSYFLLDKWLKKMSANGWHVVDCSFCIFYFEQGEPAEKEYFTYGLPANEGYYSIELRYPFLEKTYGVSKKKSKINGNTAKAYNIVEIDTKRIDIKRNAGYKELVFDRNKLYGMYSIRYFAVLIVVIVAFILFKFVL